MLFLGLSDGQLQAIASIMRKKTYREGQPVVQRGDLDDTIYVIERGSVRVRPGVSATGTFSIRNSPACAS